MANSLHSMCFVGRAEGAGIFAKAGQNVQNPEEGQPPAEPAASDLVEGLGQRRQELPCGWKGRKEWSHDKVR